jgi:hypothetical protein
MTARQRPPFAVIPLTAVVPGGPPHKVHTN